MKICGPGELMADVIREGLCIGCGACVQLCPYLRSYKGKTAMLFPCTHPRGRCFSFCPKVEVDLDAIHQLYFQSPYSGEPIGHYRTIKASQGEIPGQSSESQTKFQAGGTVSALMSFALERGYLDTAVLTSGNGAFPDPKVATGKSDVLDCAGSKYSATPTLAALNEAIKKGFNRIGVVATPCQATGIAQMRLNPLQDQAFRDPIALVIGLFCTWALEPRKFDDFLAKHAGRHSVRKMDIPPPPAEIMIIETEQDRLVFPLKEIRPMVPATCANCPDMTSEFADLSVGVLENHPDRNILIVRTERGEKLVREAVEAGRLKLEDAPRENMAHLAEAAGNKKRRAFIKMKKEGRLNSASGAKEGLRPGK